MKTHPLYKMFRSFALVIAIAALFGFASGTFAQTAVVPVCPTAPVVTSDLHIGQYDSNTNGQVTVLQQFLYDRGYMTHVPTGYFGALTMQGVINFQRSHFIITTGYVGPLTRAQLQVPACGGQTSAVSISAISPSSGQVGSTVTISGNGFSSFGTNTVHFGSGIVSNVAPVATSCPFPSFAPCYDSHTLSFTIPSSVAPYCAPNMMCAMYMQLITPGTYPIYVTNANGTSNTVYFTVTGSSANNISISGIDAPTSIVVNLQQGTWTVHVSSASSNLRYSVVWGDETINPYNGVAVASPYSQNSATFTHTYTRMGTFIPTFTVTDDQGHSASTSASVQVVNGGSTNV